MRECYAVCIPLSLRTRARRFQQASAAASSGSATDTSVRSGWHRFVQESARPGMSLADLSQQWGDLSEEDRATYRSCAPGSVCHDPCSLGPLQRIPRALTPWGMGDHERPLAPESAADLPAQIHEMDARWIEFTGSPIAASGPFHVPDVPASPCCKAAQRESGGEVGMER